MPDEELKHVDLEKDGVVHEVVMLPGPGAAGEGASSQKDEFGQPIEIPGDVVGPPMALESLMRLSHFSGPRAAIIDAIARNTVGLGHTAVPAESIARSAKTDAAGGEIVATLDRLARRDTRLVNPSFSELMYAVKHDEEEVGNGYIEVSRNRLTGKIDGLYHVPGARVRRLKNRSGWVMLAWSQSMTGYAVNIDEEVRFYNFGEKVKYDAAGAPQPKLANPAPGGWSRNELIPFQLYTSESRDYGLPRDVSITLEYAGDHLAAEQNVSFFDSSGTPPTVIFVQGDENVSGGGRVTVRVPEHVPQRIADTIRSDGGRNHRVAIIPLPPGVKPTPVPLGKFSDKDVGFVTFRDANRSRALGSFRVSGIFINDNSDAGRYTAEVERQLTQEQVFEPEQKRHESRLRETILRDLGYYDMTVQFVRMAIEGNAQKRQAAMSLATAAAIAVGELRQAHGYPLFEEVPEGDPLADVQDEFDPQLLARGLKPRGYNNRIAQVTTVRGTEPLLPETGADPDVTTKPGGRGAQQTPPGGTPQGGDQRGLRPGVGGRARRTPGQGPQSAVVDGTAALSDALKSGLQGGTR